jgi:hypothetical protein
VQIPVSTKISASGDTLALEIIYIFSLTAIRPVANASEFPCANTKGERAMRKELEEIAKIRVHNNDLWLGLLDIALRVDPEKTKEILAAIRCNDTLITKITQGIVDED